VKILLVCNPGGHFATMQSLRKFWSAHQREWVTYERFDTLQLRDKEQVHWVIKQEAREVWRAFANFGKALAILRRSRPELIVSTGAGLAVPFVLAGKLLGIKSVFIESISRAEDLSMSGKLIYNLVDELYVQWPECTVRYPRARYMGVAL
jgi:UDP-N-acetylglucosamine:LPS N-acetylglucosamine transferase